MRTNEIAHFRLGYAECRNVILFELKRILQRKDDSAIKSDLEEIVADIEHEIKKENWDEVQQISPGITEEQYEAELALFAETIKQVYYFPNGKLKPRLVKPLKNSD